MVYFFINDIISDKNTIYAYNEFMECYNVNMMYIEFYGILNAIPREWKKLIVGTLKVDSGKNKVR